MRLDTIKLINSPTKLEFYNLINIFYTQKELKLYEAFLMIVDENKLKTQHNAEVYKLFQNVIKVLEKISIINHYDKDYIYNHIREEDDINILKELYYNISKRLFTELEIDVTYLTKDNYKSYNKNLKNNYTIYKNQNNLNPHELELFKEIIFSEIPNKDKDRQLKIFKKNVGKNLTISSTIDKITKQFMDYITIIDKKFYKGKKFIDIKDETFANQYLSFSKTKNDIIPNTQKKFGNYSERNVIKLTNGVIDYNNYNNIYIKLKDYRKNLNVSEYSNIIINSSNEHHIYSKTIKDIESNPFNLIYLTQTEHYDIFHDHNNNKKINPEMQPKALLTVRNLIYNIIKDIFDDNELIDVKKYLKSQENIMIKTLFNDKLGQSYKNILEQMNN